MAYPVFINIYNILLAFSLSSMLHSIIAHTVQMHISAVATTYSSYICSCLSSIFLSLELKEKYFYNIFFSNSSNFLNANSFMSPDSQKNAHCTVYFCV